jgi:hypothetical protein
VAWGKNPQSAVENVFYEPNEIISKDIARMKQRYHPPLHSLLYETRYVEHVATIIVLIKVECEERR